MDKYAERRAKVAAWLENKGIAAAMFEDTEGRRDPSIRYLSGQPGDSLLFVTAKGRSVLVPWDANMAARYASVERVVPYGEYGRQAAKALAALAADEGLPHGALVELPAATPYPVYVDYAAEVESLDFTCRADGVDEFVLGLRAVKDEAEIDLYRRAAAITDEVADEIERMVREGRAKTEADLALFIERACRERGCEGTGFDTLAAGPGRSFGIHAFPNYTAAPFAAEGLSILDFGLKLDGYTTDVTMTFARGKLDAKRERMVALVERAYAEAVAMCRPGTATRDIALRVEAIFDEAGMKMPHALGHGVGLEAHEAPWVRTREDNLWKLAPGHVVTMEPGLYDPEAGGVRLENDVLVTETGFEVLTKSRIVRL